MGKNILGRRNSECKGPAVEVHLTWSKTSKEVSAFGVEGKQYEEMRFVQQISTRVWESGIQGSISHSLFHGMLVQSSGLGGMMPLAVRTTLCIPVALLC